MKGQILLELIIAIGIFSISVLSLSIFVLDSFSSQRLSQEFSIADYLAQEGLEATRSIRDNNWQHLKAGNHGLAISNGHFVFQGTSSSVSNNLREGIRQIQIEDIDQNRKKVISRVTWQFSEGREKEVRPITYLTNWQKGVEIRKPTSHTDFNTGLFAHPTTDPTNAYDYDGTTTFSQTDYGVSADPSITFHTWEKPTQTYTSLVLKYRYEADQGKDDRYAVAYSTNSTTTCSGTFIDLIPLTSASSPDTTISVDLSPELDLSQLCLKIYSQRVMIADWNRYIYTRDIWVEGTCVE